jgi:hypothetical protein
MTFRWAYRGTAYFKSAHYIPESKLPAARHFPHPDGIKALNIL